MTRPLALLSALLLVGLPGASHGCYIFPPAHKDPCEKLSCPQGSRCLRNEAGTEAKCECAESCPSLGDHEGSGPVCGSDGQDYPSACELNRTACLKANNVTLAFVGKCDPCAEVRCSEPEVCELDGTRQPICRCRDECSLEFSPVCGSDGKTYTNECNMRKEACKTRKTIETLYAKACNTEGCSEKKCDWYASCEIGRDGEPKCVCPTNCDDNLENSGQVCGSDGLTYESECELQKVSCSTETFIEINYRGSCELCRDVRCKNGAHCEAGSCVCPTHCPDEPSEPVCGSDTRTYASECELEKAACEQQRPGTPKTPRLTVDFFGECGKRFPVVALTTLSTSPIAGEVTASPSEQVADFGAQEACRDVHCQFNGTCELGADGAPRCSCKFDCETGSEMSHQQQQQQPVCASDSMIYPSKCAMAVQSCQQQKELRPRPLIFCEGKDIKPCSGNQPLVDEDGSEFDCGSGPNRRDCPSHAYCHQTTQFARCCVKGSQKSLLPKRCEDSYHGCCSDGKTPAAGPDGAGCPSICNCNRHGSLSDTCDPETGQCECRPGVGGLKCDRCMPGYWALNKVNKGHKGCIPCGCSVFGSTRVDCEQMQGFCVCKADVKGQKCTICEDHNKILTAQGCQSVNAVSSPKNCNELKCYSGGYCSETSNGPQCICPATCPDDVASQVTVCGSDGQTYANECELRLYACRYQTDVVPQAFGQCKDGSFMANTDYPVKRFTAIHYTQPASPIAPLSKSTKHLTVQEPDVIYYYTNTVDRKNLKQGSASVYRPTPATIKVIANHIGEYCDSNRDCPIPSSFCMGNRCICQDGYTETSSGQECSSIIDLGPTSPTEEYRACTSSPCHNLSTCIDLPGATYTCRCREDYTGFHCDARIEQKDYDIPSFIGKSFVRMNRLKAYNILNIELEFMTYADNGIVIYDQEKVDGSGDFVSLAIVDGFMQFRYNLGNGPVILTSHERVTMKTFHKVVARRYHRDGELIFNGGEEIHGQSQGILKSLDLKESTFIGNIPTNYSKVFDNIGTSHGFLGCIRKLIINNNPVDLHFGQNKDILQTYRVKECEENGCARLPCQNGATCQPLYEEDLSLRSKRRVQVKKVRNLNIVKCKGDQCLNTQYQHGLCPGPGCDYEYTTDYEETSEYPPPDFEYICVCPPQYTGKNCEHSLDPCATEPCHHSASCDVLAEGGYVCKCPPGRTGQHCEILDAELTEFLIPDFSGDGYLELPCLEGVSKNFVIEIWFLTRATDGLLLYNGQLSNGRGDFISLNLVQGKLEFRFNLGSGIANITSPDLVTLNTWHSVRISRLGREGLLRLNNGTSARGYSGTPLTELNLELPLYIAGLRYWHEIHQLAGATKGLVGAVQRVMVNDKTYQNLGYNVTRANSRIYDGLPCPSDSNPCLNGGMCFPLLNSFFCKCAKGFDGIKCEFFLGFGEEVSERAVRFDGQNYLQFKHRFGRRRKGQQSNKFELKLRTIHSEGIIAWVRRGKAEHFALYLKNGLVVLSYRTEEDDFTIHSRMRIDDGEFHQIKAVRRRYSTTLQIDELAPVKISQRTSPLTTNGKLFVGGRPGHRGVKACVRDFVADKRRVQLLRRKIDLCHENDVR